MSVVRGVETISLCAPTDPVQCTMRVMILLLVILLSDVELFWKEHRISWGNFQMLLWTIHQTHFDKTCVHTAHRNLCAHKSEHSDTHTHGELLLHWWTRLQLGLAAKNPWGSPNHRSFPLSSFPLQFFLCFYFVTDVLVLVFLSWPLDGHFSFRYIENGKQKLFICSVLSLVL